jgi:glycosyltransferase involved in cell wall biosynthesis
VEEHVAGGAQAVTGAMNIVLYTHPEFLGSQSHSHFARMLLQAYLARGHRAELRQPKAVMRRHIAHGPLAKWAGYVDQYLLFPWRMRRLMRVDPPDTLYVFCDQAVGPWVPLAVDRPHVVHCHDMLALRSALGLIPENPTSATGRVYQRYIRDGFRQARHFISISEQSRLDLHRHGQVAALTSEVVYNGLNHAYCPLNPAQASKALADAGVAQVKGEFLLHVGGGQWYKNTLGVVCLYEQLVRMRVVNGQPVPALLIVGPAPSAAMKERLAGLPACANVRFLQGVPAAALQGLYSTAAVLLFPSLAEGFGWPIAEGLACGCPVLTTDAEPMTEVGGPAAYYLPRLRSKDSIDEWAASGALVIEQILQLSPQVRLLRAEAGLRWVRRFDAEQAIDGYLAVYARVLDRELRDTRTGFPASSQTSGRS